ncbi:MAG: hypothetical protein E6R03_10770 [Hyphomicrobiaceae bacterium]|nr:MAG: hypothetical protein E6R03_10770 [Hyphomicrobiaceae bacterium]
MAEKNPLEGVSLDQLDLSDKQTRDYVSQYIDMSDPETAAYFKSFEKADIPLIDATTGQPTEQVAPMAEVPITRWDYRLKEAQGIRPGLDPENEFGGPRIFDNGLPNPLSTIRDTVDVGARGFEYLGAATNTGLDLLDKVSEKSGLADALSVGGNKFLPGSAIGALGEAFPLGGAEMGLANPAASAITKFTPEVEAAYIDVARKGSAEDIANFLHREGRPVDTAAIDQFIKDRDKAGGQISDTVRYEEPVQQELPLQKQEDLPFNAPTKEQAMESKLRQEVEDFVNNKPEDTTPDVRQRELPLEIPEHQRSFDFGEDAPKQKAINSRDTSDTVSPEVTLGVDHINDITKDWTNAPSIEVFDNFNDLKGVDSTAIGITRPDGSVAINMKAVYDEAAKNGVDPKDVLTAATYHEGLGHYGLAQKFGEDLNDLLDNWYKGSTPFRDKVDNWLAENPDTYPAEKFSPEDRIRLAAEEVLAETSAKSPLTATVLDKIKNTVKDYARRVGMKAEYSEREINSILAMAHDAVINGKGRDVSLNGFRYMKPTKKSLTSQKMKTVSDVDDILNDAYANTDRPDSISDIDAAKAADEMGLTYSKYVQKKSLQDQGVQKLIIGAHRLLTSLTDDLAKMEETARTSGMDVNLHLRMRETEKKIQAVMGRFDEDTAEVGRALRSLRTVQESARSAKTRAELRRQLEADGVDLSNPDEYMKYMATFRAILAAGNKGQAVKFLQNHNKLHIEDYANSVTTNFMLSSPVTTAKNAIGSPLNFTNEFLGDSIASLVGQVGRTTSMDRIYAREMGASVQGLLAGFWNLDTAKAVGKAFVDGKGTSKFAHDDHVALPLWEGSSGIQNKPARVAAKTASAVVEAPRRVNSAIDQAWRSILGSGNLYRTVARDLIKEGKFSQENLLNGINNPTADQITKANKVTDSQLFNDAPSKFTQKIVDVLRTKYEPETSITLMKDEASGKQRASGKRVSDADSPSMRTAKFAARQVVRFMPTLDSIARTAIKNSGPFALISKEIRADLKAGGAARQSAIARIATSSALLGYFAHLAAEGYITPPQAPGDDKADILNSSRPYSSIKVGDTWYNYSGYDPISSYLSAASRGVDKANGAYLDNPDLYIGLTIGLAQSLYNSTYAESMVNLMKAVSETSESVQNGEAKIGPSLANIIGSQTQNVTNPAFVRWYKQTWDDPYARDTTGDKSGIDRILGKTESGSFFGNDELPQKYDIFGRPLLNTRQSRQVESDAVALEIERLQSANEDRVIPKLSTSVKYEEMDESIKLTGEAKAKWSETLGKLFHQYLEEDMSSDEYLNGSDDIKKQIIKDAYDDAREDTKEELRTFFQVPEEVQ